MSLKAGSERSKISEAQDEVERITHILKLASLGYFNFFGGPMDVRAVLDAVREMVRMSLIGETSTVRSEPPPDQTGTGIFYRFRANCARTDTYPLARTSSLVSTAKHYVTQLTQHSRDSANATDQYARSKHGPAVQVSDSYRPWCLRVRIPSGPRRYRITTEKGPTVSFDDETPIREVLLSDTRAVIAKHKGKHTVVEWDVQLQTWPDRGGTLINAWCVIITVVGALIGRTNYLSYTWTFQPPDPKSPTDNAIEEGVVEAFKRLSMMQVRQLQQQSPQRGGNSPN